MEQSDRLELLKEILLTEEKVVTSDLSEKVAKLNRIFEEEEELAKRINPLVDNKIDNLIREMPAKLSPVITESLKNEIKNSQDAVIEALFPIIGKLIKKYISHEMKLLNEKINKQIEEAFSFKNWFKSKKERSRVVDNAFVATDKPQLVQVLVIEKGSGLLKAGYTNPDAETMDEELIAGMLTAIKSFVQDAYSGGDQDLETIAYDFYTLHIQNFQNYYIVAAINGIYTLETKDRVEDLLLDFAANGVSKEAVANNELFSNKLKLFFSDKSI